MMAAAGAAASSFDKLRMKNISLGDAMKSLSHAEPCMGILLSSGLDGCGARLRQDLQLVMAL